MSYYIGVLKKYAQFSGRARRKEYWMFVLFNFIIAVVIELIAHVLNANVIYYIYALAVLIPSLAVLIRRLHDTGRSAWWVLIGLIPLVGAIVVIVFAALDGQPGSNKYGPDPKGEMPANAVVAPMSQ